MLDQLLLELLDVVLTHIDRVDTIKNLRLSCKALAIHGLPHLVATLEIKIDKESVERAVALTKHHARSFVRVFKIMQGHLALSETTVDYSGYRCPNCDINPYHHTIELDELSKRNKTHYAYQQEVLRSGEYLQIIRELCAGLTGLRTLNIGHWKDRCGDHMLNEDSLSLTADLLHAALEGLRSSGVRITRLAVEGFHWDFFSPDVFLPEDKNFHMGSMVDLRFDGECFVNGLASNLHHCGPEKFREGPELGFFRDLLASAPNLESLCLYPGPPSGESPFTFEWSIGESHWPRLRNIELGNVQTRYNDIVLFFRRHADSLKTLTLANMWLTDATINPTWIHIFQDMQKCLKLKDANFGGCFNWVIDDVDHALWTGEKVYDDGEYQIHVADNLKFNFFAQFTDECSDKLTEYIMIALKTFPMGSLDGLNLDDLADAISLIS